MAVNIFSPKADIYNEAKCGTDYFLLLLSNLGGRIESNFHPGRRALTRLFYDQKKAYEKFTNSHLQIYPLPQAL